MSKHKVELGDEVRCKVTGFKGIVTAIAQHITGCDRADVRPGIKKDGTLADGYWFDLPALEIIKKQKVKPTNVQTVEDAPVRKVGGPPTRSFQAGR